MPNYDEILTEIKNETLDIRDIPNDIFSIDLAYKIFSINKKYSVRYNQFLNDMNFITFLLKNNIYSVYNFYDFIEKDEIKTKTLKYLEDNNFIINVEDACSDMLSSYKIVYNSIKSTKYPYIINYTLLKEIDDNMANLLIDLNYIPNPITPSILFSNEKLIYYFMKYNINYFDRAYNDAINDETIEYAFSHGFKINKNSLLLSDSKVLKYLAYNNPNIINYAAKEAMTEEIAHIASLNGFVFKYHGQRYDKVISTEEFFSDVTEYLEADNNLFLLEYPDLVLSTYNNNHKEILFQEIIKDNKYMPYMIKDAIESKLSISNFRNEDIINNEQISKYIFDNYFKSKLSQDILTYLFTIYPYREVLFNLDKLSILLSDSFIEEFGISNTLMIIKFIIIPNDELNILNYSNEELKYINKILKTILDTSQLFVINFKKYINYFSLNKELLYDIIDNLDILSNKDYINIKVIIDSNIKCDKVISIDKVRRNQYNNMNISIKNKVSLYLFGCDYDSLIDFINTKLNSTKIEILEKKGIIVSNESKYIIHSIERIINLDNKNLNKIWDNISYYPVYPISKLKEYTKNLYFNMYKNNITNLKNKEVSFYKDNVPIYEYKGEAFSFLMHALNACTVSYTEEKTIYDSYTNNYGKSYLCTSFINQYNLNVAANENSFMFGYNYFSKEQLLAMDRKTIRSCGENNNTLNVSYRSDSYYDPNEMAIRSTSYNEMDFYRQNNKGCRMTPNCMIFFDKIGDISIAKKLKIPVVLIHTKYYKEDFLSKELEIIKEEILKGKIYKLNDYIGLYSKLYHNINIEDIKELLSNISDNDIEIVKYILESYNIDKQLVLKKSH